MRRVIYLIVFLLVLGIVIFQIRQHQERKLRRIERALEEELIKEFRQERSERIPRRVVRLPGRFDEMTSETVVAGSESLTTGGVTAIGDTESTPTEVAKEPSGSISGRVLDATKSPIQEAQLTLVAYQEKEELFTRNTLSDKEGKYIFSGLPAGSYEIRAFHSLYATRSKPNIQLSENQQLKDIDIILTNGATLKGKVIDSSKNPISEAKVTVERKSTRIVLSGGAPVTISYACATGVTGNDGAFTLNHIPGGEIVIIAEKSGYSEARLPLSINEESPPPELTLILNQSAEIGAEVVDPEGGVVVGATVLAIAYTGKDGKRHSIPENKCPKATSDKDGKVLLKGLLAETKYELKVKAAGFPEARFSDIKSNTYANKLVLQFGGSISGKVTFLENGKPAPNIRIRAEKKDESGFMVSVLSDSQGTYTFQDLPPGTYYVGIDSGIYTARAYENVKVESTKSVKGIDFKIYKGLTISGEVIDNLSKTGVANATVYLEGEMAGGGKKNLKMTSSQDGSFSFTNLPEGIYFLHAVATGYVVKNSPHDKKKVILKIGEATPFVTIKLYRGGSISGVVYNKNREPVGLAFVRAFKPPGTRGRINTKNLQAITDTGGTFKMEGIDVSGAIELVLSASADGYADGISDPIVLTPSMPDATAEIVLGEGATIIGKVLEGASDGPPLADVKVSLYNHKFSGDRYYKRRVTWTDGNGNFYFYGVSSGRVSLSAQRYGYINAGASVTIKEGETKEVQIIMHPGTSIVGYVVDDLGQPLEGAYVHASPQRGARGSGGGRTDAMGRFVITKVGEGLFTLTASYTKHAPQGRQSYRRRLRNVPSGTDNAVIVFPINAEITGRVYDSATNKPIEGFIVGGSGSVEFDDEGNKTGFGIASKRYVQTSGEFQCAYLPTGEYTLIFSAPGYVTKTLSKISIASPEKIDIGTILLSRGGTIKATLLSDNTEEPVGGVRGVLDKGLARHAGSNADGLMVFNNLADGIYNLTLSHGHYITKIVPNIPVTAGEVTDLGVIYLEAGATIEGRVKNAEDKPMSGVGITVRSSEKTHKTRTDKFGYYLVDGVKRGEVEVTAQTKIAGQTVMKSKNLEVDPDVLYEVNFIFDYSYVLRGALEATQFGLSRPKVYIYELNENNEIREGRKRVITPGADLTFEARNLLQGRYFIIATAKPIETITPPQVTLSETRSYAQVELTTLHERNIVLYFGSGLVSGVVLDQDTGEPVSGMDVVVKREPEVGVSTPATLDKFTFSTVTGDDGKFTFFPLPSGDYNLYVGSEYIQRIILGEDQHITGINIVH